MRQITDRLLSHYLKADGSLAILDAGCGAGGNLSALSRFGRVVGLDYSPLALGYAAQKHAGKLARATIEALPYADNAFDLVTSFDVMICHEVRDDMNALREFARVTRPGGYVLLRLAALEALRGPHDIVVHGLRRYHAAELRTKLEQVNLRPVRITYANSLLMPMIFTIRKAQSLGLKMGGEAKSDVNQTPEPANTILTNLLNLEASWIGGGHSFPAGVSLFGLAVKPG